MREFKISSIKKKLKLKELLSKLDNYEEAEIPFKELEDLGVKSNKLAVYLMVCECCIEMTHEEFGDLDYEYILFESGLNEGGESDGMFDEEILARCFDGSFLPTISKNFKLENNFPYERIKKAEYKLNNDIGYDYLNEYWDIHLISSKLNKTLYMLAFHSCEGREGEGFEHYSIKNKFNNKTKALNYIQKYLVKLKKDNPDMWNE